MFDALVQKGVANKIALAHHTQDQAETILLHMFRGAGLSGVKGMDYQKGNAYIRPMLSTPKQAVLDYLEQNNIPNIEDETNFENTYTRNYLRNVVLPLIIKKWPNVVNSIINFGKSAAEDDDYIQKNLNDHAVLTEGKIAKIPLAYFSYDKPIVARIIFKALHGIGIGEDIERKHVEAIIDLAVNSENGKKIDLPLGVNAYKEYEYLTLTNKKRKTIYLNQELKCGKFEVEGFGGISVKRVKEFKPKQNVLYIDEKKIPRDAVWRFRKNGDIFEKFGGGTKKLKDFLIDRKVPQRERTSIPVLASGNEVYAIAGIEISEKAKLDPSSKSALRIEVKKHG